MNKNIVSVIVPVRNAESTIDICLKSLMKQDYNNIEIIVVDNMSTDKSVDRILTYPVTLLHERKINSYAARNNGIRASTGDIVAFLDADCIAHPSWIRSLIKNYSSKVVGGVGGQVIPYTRHTPRSIVEKYTIASRCYPSYPYQTQRPIVLKRRKGVLLAGVLYTANASYRRSILERLNGFDESLKSGGDIDMSYRVQDLGYQLVWDPKAIVFHVQRSTCKGLIQQYFRYGTCVAPLVKKHFNNSRYFVLQHYFNIVKNLLLFATRLLMFPFHRGDKILYLVTPLLDNLTLVALIMGKFYGNLHCKVFIL